MNRLVTFVAMSLIVILSILVRQCFATSPGNLHPERIVYSMDNSHLSPYSSSSSPLTHSLFDIRWLSGKSHAMNDIDLHSFGHLSIVIDLYDSLGMAKPWYLSDMIRIENIFNNKVNWKDWMVKVGLGDNIPKVYNPSDNPDSFDYPLILKLNSHFGRGVYVMHSREDLDHMTAKLNGDNTPYILEESLTGLGYSEISAFGSVFQGKLLSLRCVKRTFDPADTVAGTYRNSSFKQNDSKPTKAVPFITGVNLRDPSDEHWLPCGKDLRDMAERMMSAANYTGPWCAELKMDDNKRLKMLEANSRFCGTMRETDALFLSVFVPLAFAIAKVEPSSVMGKKLTSGTLAVSYKRILEYEDKVLATAGGSFVNEWLEVDVFDPSLRLDFIGSFFTPREIFSGVKISLGVVGAHFADYIRKLPGANEIIAVTAVLSSSEIAGNLDLVIGTAIDLVPVLHHCTVSHLQPLGNNEIAANILNNPVVWIEWMKQIGLGTHISIAEENIHMSHTHDLSSSPPLMLGVYGAVHNGKLLSMRCIERVKLSHEDDHHHHHNHHHDSHRSSDSEKRALIACSQEVVQVFREIFSKASTYTGPYCADLSPPQSADGKVQIFNLHAELCDTMLKSDALFISTVVPLAVALTSNSGETGREWYKARPVFQHIVDVERAVLQSGGDAEHDEVVSFIPDGVLGSYGYEFEGAHDIKL